MNINLTQKERMLLEDQKKHEQLCIEKYSNYASMTVNPQLQQLCQTLAGKEQEHYNTLDQILSGQMPALNQTPSMAQEVQASPQYIMQNAMMNENEKALCEDMLMTEKYVSGNYDTAIFECTSSQLRQVLNHIQTEEQKHGEQIFNHMKNRGMYDVQ